MRRVAALFGALLMLATAVGCEPTRHTSSGGGLLGQGNGYVNRQWWQARQDGYLEFATKSLDRASPTNVLAHLARAARDKSFVFDPSTVRPSDFQQGFDKIDRFQDTSDFDLLSMIALWSGYRRSITPELRAAIEQRMLGFRYWYTDPLPRGVIDNKWFWTENHQIIMHTLEYLAGRGLSHKRFKVTGLTGREVERRGRARVVAWLDDKARFGFAEWHSDVYYQEDIEALTLLTEYAEPHIAQRAAAVLDLFLYDLAIHQLKGNNGVTHGRSYMKDKSKATDEDVFSLIKLLFDTSDQPYPSGSETGATLLAASHRYRLPEVIRRVARTHRVLVDREAMGAPLDLDQPFSTNPPSPVPGVTFTDAKDVPFWWQRGALTAWQFVPRTLATIDQYHLFDTELFKPFKPLVDITGGDPAVAQSLAYSLRCMINIGVLSKVDTITYRSAHAMLSSAQDYRRGCFGDQYHAWQATLDEDAVVFTTHPGNEPRTGTSGWEDGDLYWSGTGSMPKDTQYGAAAIHQYAPAFASPTGPPLDAFGYLPYTHAYFPTERFDEVRQVGHWTIARKGKGYVALYSWRPTHWRVHNPAKVFTNGLTKPFDLVAGGGANNVWISEVGDANRWGSFDRFVRAVARAHVAVTDLGSAAGISKGFDVAYTSPTEGRMAVSWTGPLKVRGTDVALHRSARYDNPFGRTPAGSSKVAIRKGDARLSINLTSGRRTAVLSRR
ncbi:MAG: hypothetical protein M3Z46_13180 [Actinomycetota bacterium]|nr:hypothetical protein [Actinomycetota bacterium]